MPGMLQPQRELTWSEDGQRLLSIRVRSFFSGKWNTVEYSHDPCVITRAQWDAWQGGQHIQNAMPQLSDSEREFLISGATPEEWEAEFGGEED